MTAIIVPPEREGGGDGFPQETLAGAEADSGRSNDAETTRLRQELDQARQTIRILQEELDQTSRGLVVLTLELDRKREEIQNSTEQLWQAGKLATVGEMAASVAHELNNPLTAIMLWTEKLLMDMPTDHPKRAGLVVIDQETARMARLVRNLLLSCRRGPPVRAPVDPAEEADGTIELVQHVLQKQGVTVVREFDPRSPRVQADRQQLRQIFLNLVTNAVDAMPRGGTLTIRVGPVQDAEALPGSVQIEVADTGQGIPADLLPRVMEPFFTTRPEGRGTGLGLSICRRIVAEHGGTIRVRSTVDVGTSVLVILPPEGRPTAARKPPN
jgi:signal transduction histidine kinase